MWPTDLLFVYALDNGSSQTHRSGWRKESGLDWVLEGFEDSVGRYLHENLLVQLYDNPWPLILDKTEYAL